jgi:hypothetical protein
MSADPLPVLRPVRVPWNKRRSIGKRRPILPMHVRSIRVRLGMSGNARDLALVNMAAGGKLQGCNLACLRVRDFRAAGRVRERTAMLHSKTRKPVRFEITRTARSSLERWIRDPVMAGHEFLRPSRIDRSPHLSTRPYARIVRGRVMSLGLEPSAYGTHSMRRTKVAQMCKATGNLRAVQQPLGPTKMATTVRYLGGHIKTALSLSDGVDLLATVPTGAIRAGRLTPVPHVDRHYCAQLPRTGHSSKLRHHAEAKCHLRVPSPIWSAARVQGLHRNRTQTRAAALRPFAADRRHLGQPRTRATSGDHQLCPHQHPRLVEMGPPRRTP